MAKKRKGKAGTYRRGMSGNPARRAEQLTATSRSAGRDVDTLPRWWPASHTTIVEQAMDLAPTGSPLELETRAAGIVGAEYWARFQSEKGGFHGDAWLAALADLAGDELQVALRTGEEWRGLWRFLHGLAVMVPPGARQSLMRDPDGAGREAIRSAANSITAAGATAPWPTDVARAEPAGDPLMAVDGYGSRFALLAPFSWRKIDQHWYRWDVDRCGTDTIVAAGVFASSEEALAEWRTAVGSAAAGAELVTCDGATVRNLLSPLAHTGFFGNLLTGFESRELIVEQFRMRQRAMALLAKFPDEGQTPLDLDAVVDDFAAWFAARKGSRPARDDIGILADSWSGVLSPFSYACSPHRIEHTVVLVRDMYLKEHAKAALDLLPEWVEWCIERSGLSGELATRARTAARDDKGDGITGEALRRAE
ncbi:hypothetical protein AB0L65_03565 [Nonomuraea sp. NPDC052116]|uniref:hypothetical protein n=1 Tax=Nonomuraea sp. NPDC052116 TaxID=3155665 RepID=UPI003440EF58